MSVLDKTGLTILWSKIKALASKYLPLDGGTITGYLTVNGTLTTNVINILINDSIYNLDVEKCKELKILTKVEF